MTPYFHAFILIGLLSFGTVSMVMLEAVDNRDHLVVLSHGILGRSNDLSYLAGQLQQKGFNVLSSRSNEVYRTLEGVASAGERLKDEILSEVQERPYISKISFAGNSLGGIFVRFVISLLYNPIDGKIAGLDPCNFLVS